MRRESFGDMCARVGSFTRLDTSTESQEVIRNAINRAYEHIAASQEWKELIGYLNEGITFTADESYLVLPGDAAEAIQIQDKGQTFKLYKKSLKRMVQDNLQRIDNSSTPIFYSDLGYRATKRPLATDVALNVLTDNSADTSVKVRVEGLRASPEVTDTEIITTHASTPDSTEVAGSITWREGWSILSISVDQALTSFIKVREDVTADTEVAVLTEHHRDSRYLVLLLEEAPSAARNLNIIYKKRIRPLERDDDLPVIAASDAIVESAIATARRYKREYSQAREHDAIAGSLVASAFSEQSAQGEHSQFSRPMAAMRRRRCTRR